MRRINYRQTGICPVALILVLLCRECRGASLPNKGEHQQTETIVAVAGVSPALLDTALSLFDQSGKNGNWQFTTGILGGKDKFLPFPMIEAPRPLMPMRPGFLSMPKPQQTTAEKDQVQIPSPMKPLTPLEPPETVPEVASESLESFESFHIEEHEPVAPLPFTAPAASPPEMQSPEEEYHSQPHPAEQSEVEVLGTGWSPPTTTQPPSTGNTGWSQNAQGGHNTAGNQILNMNLNANLADFTHSSNVNMHVVTDGSSNSNVHYFGSRLDQHLKPHHGQTHANGLTSYKIQFKKEVNAPRGSKN